MTCVQQPEVPFELEADVNLTPARLLDATAGVKGGAVSLLSFFADAASSFSLSLAANGRGR